MILSVVDCRKLVSKVYVLVNPGYQDFHRSENSSSLQQKYKINVNKINQEK